MQSAHLWSAALFIGAHLCLNDLSIITSVRSSMQGLERALDINNSGNTLILHMQKDDMPEQERCYFVLPQVRFNWREELDFRKFTERCARINSASRLNIRAAKPVHLRPFE
jgi:hypothetical protein